jgi:hypothetical protein
VDEGEGDSPIATPGTRWLNNGMDAAQGLIDIRTHPSNPEVELSSADLRKNELCVKKYQRKEIFTANAKNPGNKETKPKDQGLMEMTMDDFIVNNFNRGEPWNYPMYR